MCLKRFGHIIGIGVLQGTSFAETHSSELDGTALGDLGHILYNTVHQKCMRYFFHYSGINYTITTAISENNSDDTNNNINKLK